MNSTKTQLSSLTKIAPRRLSDDVIEQIGTQIRDGNFKPGERLPSERDLAKHFGVSRSLVRESLRILESLGMVIVKRGVGVHVVGSRRNKPDASSGTKSSSSPNDAMVLLEVLKVVSAEAASRAAEHFTNDQVEPLERILELHRIAAESHSTFRAASYDKQFHDVIFTIAGSDSLRAIGIVAREQLGPGYHGIQTQDLRMKQAVQEHADILLALKEKNGGQAARAMQLHLEQSQIAIQLMLNEQAISTQPKPDSQQSSLKEGIKDVTF